jgi:2-oxoglutarate ferredoxin oxidoreductase subunit beta
LKTYGFHGIHGRALPVATGIRLHRPDLTVFVVMGDGDCTSIGAAHWIHALRYNPDLVVLLLDNGIYGLTKLQTSPTTPRGFATNTQPRGSLLEPLDPLQVALGVTNASFVAQTAEWAPAHLFATLRTAYRHKGLSFVRILQRCPIYAGPVYQTLVTDPANIALLVHDDGVVVPELGKVYANQVAHDPHDIHAARRIAGDREHINLGLLFVDPSRPRYEESRRVTPRTAAERVTLLDAELDRYAV